jgi:hypothetical protein
MRTVSILTLAALAAGCNEYNLEGQTGPGDGPIGDSDEHVDTSSGVPGEDCLDKVIDGYATSSDADCANEIETGTFTPVVEWKMENFSTMGNQVMSQPIVASVNDDDGDGDVDTNDIPDIIVVTYDNSNYSSGGILRAISGDGSRELWSNGSGGIQGTGGVAAGDIDGDGLVELVSLTPSGVTAFENDGTIKWTRNNLSGHISGTSDVAAISDMDGDGTPEIIAGKAILNNDGTLRGSGNRGMGGVEYNNVGVCSFAVDVDGDGKQEVVTGNALYKPSGEAKAVSSLQDGYPAVADFDGDGQAEIVAVGQGTIRVLDTDMTTLWTKPIPGASGSYYGGPPTVADYDGDGEPEIGVASGSRYSVFEGDGTLLWQAVTDDSSSGNTGSAVFDFEGDGAAEVVYADQTRLWVFSGADGSVKLASTEHSNGTWLEYPSIADVDGDGHAEIVVPNEAQNGGKTGITVFGDADNSWQPGRKIWNQHAYHITNVKDDGTIPKKADLNWLTFNNFRSGDVLSGDGLSAPDLTIAQGDLCEIDCDEDRIVAWVHVGNEGAADVDVSANPVVDAYAVIGGDEVLLTSVAITETVPVGRYLDSVQIEIEGYDPTEFERLIFRVHSAAPECNEDNNSVRWAGPFCE